MRSKVRQNKVGENGYCRNYFIKKSFSHRSPVINSKSTKLQRMYGDKKKAIFGNSKERIPSLVHLSSEHELICFVYKVESCT